MESFLPVVVDISPSNTTGETVEARKSQGLLITKVTIAVILAEVGIVSISIDHDESRPCQSITNYACGHVTYSSLSPPRSAPRVVS
jgi:hypothetical protein